MLTFPSFDKDETPQPKTHHRSGTLDETTSGVVMHQPPSGVHCPPPPPPLAPSFSKIPRESSVSPNTPHPKSSFTYSASFRDHDTRQDSFAYTNTDPLSSPTQTHVSTRSMSPSKFPRAAKESISASTATTRTVDTGINQPGMVSRPTTCGNNGKMGSSASPSPSKSHRRIFEDPEMTDASSSAYSMDELIRAMPHIHPLYVKRIAKMGPPSRTSGHSPEHSPTALQEYAA